MLGIGHQPSAKDPRHLRDRVRNKPSSVRRRSGGGSFIWDRHCWRPRAAYPGLRRGGQPLVPYLALLRVGFTMRLPSPAARCALTAPFHPCLCRRPEERPAIGGLLSAALSVTLCAEALGAPGRYPAPCPVELGLSSAGTTEVARRRPSLRTLSYQLGRKIRRNLRRIYHRHQRRKAKGDGVHPQPRRASHAWEKG